MRWGEILIGALYNLGKFIVEYEELDELDVFQDTAKLKKKTKRVLLVNLEDMDEKFVYRGVIEEELDKSREKLKKYLFVNSLI